MKLIGEILLDNGLLTHSQLDAALLKQKEMTHPVPIGEILISMGYIEISTLMRYLDLQLKSQ